MLLDWPFQLCFWRDLNGLYLKVFRCGVQKVFQMSQGQTSFELQPKPWSQKVREPFGCTCAVVCFAKWIGVTV